MVLLFLAGCRGDSTVTPGTPVEQEPLRIADGPESIKQLDEWGVVYKQYEKVCSVVRPTNEQDTLSNNVHCSSHCRTIGLISSSTSYSIGRSGDVEEEITRPLKCV